ncbi:DNA gyrase subunit A [Myxococcota bacterium]|nr:DNA gyrase subunit A [Myxococcota bacterium]
MEDARKALIPVNIEDEMRVSYLDYAMSVVIGRALPDVRDGLKPVHRRALFTMYELKNNWNSAYKKSARIVGDCIGKYHPHGDQAVYDTIVRMAQDFAMRYCLVDGQGNFGSVDGDPPAAMRYTEVRMAKITHELLADIEKETVEYGPNYDDTLEEPLVLPTRVPNLLVNGGTGIAVGMATNIPPHNLKEIVDGCIAVMRNPDITLPELMAMIPGPDFPTGGTIHGASGIREAYETGRGIIHIRAVCEFESMGNDRERIVVHELPYQVNKARLLEKIADLVRDKKIEGISDLRDESDRHGMRMVIELRRDAQADIVLNQLYKLTQLQQSFGINMLAIVHGEPRLLTLRDALQHFIDHRRDVTLRRTRFELRQAEERAHILEGLKIALDHLDEVIALIRASADAETAREGLMSTFGLSERQAKAILEMRLQRLTGLERDKILQELAEVQAEITRLKAILADEGLLLEVIERELRDVQAQFSDGRKTQIIAGGVDLDIEDLIPVEDMVVTVTHEGYIKRVPVAEYRAQKRGGRGKSGMATKETDFVEHLVACSTHDHVLFFTSNGRVFSEKVYQIPSGARTGRGKPIVNLLPLEVGEKLASVLTVDAFTEGHFLFFATTGGTVKKTDLMAYSNIRSSGIIAINLREGDRLMGVRLTNGNSNVLLATKSGMSIRFEEADVRPLGRDTSGVKGIELNEEERDEVVGCITFDPAQIDEKQACLLTVTATGYGKRTALEEYRLQGRGGKGTIDIKAGGRNGDVVGCILVEHDYDHYILITDGGIILRAEASDVRLVGRNTMGVRMIAVEEGEKVVSIARYSDEEETAEVEAAIDGEATDGEGDGDATGSGEGDDGEV